MNSQITPVKDSKMVLSDNERLRKKIEALEKQVQLLSQRDAQWQALVNTSPNVMVMFNEENRVAFVSPRVQDFFGISSENLIGASMENFFNKIKDCFVDFPGLRKCLQEKSLNFREMFSGGFDPNHIYKSGFELIKPQPRMVFASLWPLAQKHNDNAGKIYVFVDITRFRQVEKALRDSEQRFRTLLENSNDIIVSIDKTGKFIYISPNFAEITGHNVANYIGKPFKTLIHPEDRSRVSEVYKKIIKTNEDQQNTGFRVKNKAGNWRWFTTTDSVIKDENGNFLYVVSIVHDITEMKKIIQNLQKAHEDLKSTQAKLAQTEKMADLVRLATSITHEINTPLGAIKSLNHTNNRAVNKLKSILSDVLEQQSIEDRGLKAIFQMIEDTQQVIEEGSERINKIIRTLRHFVRLDEAKLKAANLNEGLEDTLTLLQPELKDRIKVKKLFGDLPLVVCRPGQINQVFHNILVDAVEAIKGSGEILITTYRKNEHVYIAFKDTGEGIAEENIPKIFETGFTTKGKDAGTGLGLSISHQIIQEHRGEIRVESQLGKGSTFTVILPVNPMLKSDLS